MEVFEIRDGTEVKRKEVDTAKEAGESQNNIKHLNLIESASKKPKYLGDNVRKTKNEIGKVKGPKKIRIAA